MEAVLPLVHSLDMYFHVVFPRKHPAAVLTDEALVLLVVLLVPELGPGLAERLARHSEALGVI